MPSEPPPPSGPPVDGLPPPVEVPWHATPQKLHPLSVVVGIPLMQLVQALFFPAAALVATGARLTIGLLVVIATFGLIARLVAWRRFRFSFDGNVLRVTSGVLRRGHRSVDAARIQQVEVDRPFLQRLTGTATLHVETAGGSSEPGVRLAVLRHSEAVDLRRALREGRERSRTAEDDSPDDDSEPAPVLRVGHRRVALASITGVQLLVLPALVGGALQLAGGRLTRWTEALVERLRSGPGELWEANPVVVGIALAVGGLVLAVIAATVVGLVRDGGFRIDRSGRDLLVRRGLLGTRDSTVPRPRIQLVEVLRNPMRRALGYATVRVHSAGGASGPDHRVAVPLVRNDEVEDVVRELLPEFDRLPPLAGHPRAALQRALWRWLRPWTLIAIVVWSATEIFDPLALAGAARAASLAAIPAAAVLAVADYRHLAHALDERVVAVRRGALASSTRVAPVEKIQVVSSRANLFQRRLGLETVVAHLAGPGGDLEIIDVDRDTARRLHDRLVEHAASPRAVRSPA